MTRKKTIGGIGIAILVLGFVSCSKKPEPPQTGKSEPVTTEPTTANPTLPVPASRAPEPQVARGVQTEMRRVKFHLTPRAAAHLEVLAGELWPTGKNTMVTFDDKTSFEVRVTNGTVSIRPEALADIMNSYVFAKPDAPLKDLQVSIDDGKLVIRGKLHTKGDVPFATQGTLSTTPQGLLRMKTEKISALKIPVKGLMGVFGIDLANIVNTAKIQGIGTDKNDLLMDLGTLLPPPHIKGKVVAVRVDKDAIVTIFGDGGKSLGPPKDKGSYMAFWDNSVKFGKMVMTPTDLTVLDLDPADELDWDQDHYQQQLEAGYSKITSNFGLRTYAKDYGKLKTEPKAGD